MVIKRNIFLILFIALSFSISEAATTKTTTEQKKETTKNNKTSNKSNIDTTVTQNNTTNSDASNKLNELRAKREARKEVKTNEPSGASKKPDSSSEPVTLNVPSPNDKEISSSSDWMPKLNKDPTPQSKARLEQHEKDQEKLVDQLLKNNYDTYTPPKELYDNYNKGNNKHLPPVYLKSEYFDIAFKAVETDNEDALRAVLSGSNFLNQQNQNGDTILIYAIQNRAINSARILLAKGALTDIANNRRRTALHYAASLGNAESTKLLLSMGANPNLRDDMDMTPLDYAVLNKHEQVSSIIDKYLSTK